MEKSFMVKFSTNVLITNVRCLFLFLLLPNIIVVLYIASSFGLCCFTCGFVLSYFAIVGFTVFWNFWFCFVLFCFLILTIIHNLIFTNCFLYFWFCFVLLSFVIIIFLFCCYFTTLHAFSACQVAKKPTNRLLPFFSF